MSSTLQEITGPAYTTAQEVIRKYESLVTETKHQEGELEKLQKTLTEHQEEATRIDMVRTFFSLLEERARIELETKVSSLVNYGLQTVFGENYSFKIKSEFKGNAIRTEFFVVDHGLELPFLDATGGGLGDVASFLLRVVMLSITKPSQRKLLILDEPFKFVSTEYFANVGELLKELSSSLGVQCIIVTHKPELIPYADLVVETSNSGKNTSKATIR